MDVWKCVKNRECKFVRGQHTPDSQHICTCGGRNDPELCVTVGCDQKSPQTRGIKSVCKYDISKDFDCSRTLTNSNKIQQADTSGYNKSKRIEILQKGEIDKKKKHLPQ